LLNIGTETLCHIHRVYHDGDEKCGELSSRRDGLDCACARNGQAVARRLDFKKLPFNKDTLMLRLAVALGIFPRGDHRNWDAIRICAKALSPLL
jgi:hypothetical protein